jgi:carbon storage regulator CsrA
MLVLSRSVTQKILFPGFETTVEVVSIKGNAVRLGIHAPPEVTVLRQELRDLHAEWNATAPPGRDPLTRLLSSRLKVAGVGLEELRAQLEAGRAVDALALVERLAEDFDLLRQRLSGAEQAPSPRPQPTPGLRKALVVEDNANERELLAGFLRQSGFQVDTAGDGADALDYLRARTRPDVVLLDMGMPRCDGPTTVREIRKDLGLSGLKIVAVSGHQPEEYDLQPGPGSVDRWVSKPVDPDMLVRDLEGVMSRPSAS